MLQVLLILPTLVSSKGYNTKACVSCGTNIFDCQTCTSGYSLINGRCVPDACHADCQYAEECYGTGSNECCDSSTATPCNDLELYNQGCTDPGCESCPDSAGDCYSCRNCFGFDQTGKCCAVENCLECAGSNVCRLCKSPDSSGNLLGLASDGTCQKCEKANCAVCLSDKTNCDQCNDGFFYDGTNCTACTDDMCLACSDATTCTKCNSSANLSAGDCVCPSGYGKSGDNSTCYACLDPHCTNCGASYQTCTACEDFYIASGGSCTQPISNCKTYSTTTDCTVCADGYRRQNATTCQACTVSNCQNCDTLVSQCDTCMTSYRRVNATTCQRCSHEYCTSCTANIDTCLACDNTAGYFLSGTTCVFVDVNCLTIDGSNNCTSCVDGFGVDAGKCAECTKVNCLKCPASKSTCTECDVGFGVSGGSCAACGANCLECAANVSTCTSVPDGFYITGGTGTACADANCVACSNASNCTQCSDGYVLISDKCVDPFCANNTCSTCTAGYGLTPEGNCAPCLAGSNCSDCLADYRICTTCTSGATDFCCTDANCVDCSNDPSQCLKCTTNYGVDTNASNTCALCNTTIGCLANGCSPYNVDVCETCDTTNYTLSGSKCCSNHCDVCGLAGGCDDCSYGYGLNGTICQLCNMNLCLDCSNFNTCTVFKNHTDQNASAPTCLAGYGYNSTDNECFPCQSTLCSTCTADYQTCTNCGVYNLVGSICCEGTNCLTCNYDGTCQTCATGYFVASSGNCEACIANCDVCANNSTCTSCTASFVGNYNSSQCCQTQYCQSCDGAGVCTICQSGYTLNGANECVPNYCTSHNNVAGVITCTACESGYGLISNQCLQCQKALCEDCPGDVNSCSDCGSYATWDTNECKVDNCQTVSSSTKSICDQCSQGYGFKNGVFKTICLNCSAANCSECYANHTICNKCTLGNGFDAVKSCQACAPTQCQECYADKDQCEVCNPGTFLSASGECCQNQNCSTCAGYSTCDGCISNFGLSVGGACVACTDTNCEQCNGNSPSTCNSCIADMDLSFGSLCCYSNCSSCSFPPQCDMGLCNEGYRSDIDGRCQQCDDPKCKNCDVNSANCTECQSGRTFNNIARCCDASDCLNCSNQSICDECKLGMGASGGQCVACQVYRCTDCGNDANLCRTCQSGYHPSPSGTECWQNCPYANQVRISVSTCQYCTDPNCQQCPGDVNTCTTCKSGFEFNGMGDCCRETCLDCSSNSWGCSNCGTAKGFNRIALQCVACTDWNCSTCISDYQVCTACNAPYTLSSNKDCCIANCQDCSSSPPICEKCDLGYGDNAGICSSCSVSNCQECFTDHSICEICTPPYILVNNYCCNPNCTDCIASAPSCTTCVSGFGLNGSGECIECSIKDCTECQANYANTCTQCSNNLSLFNSPPDCCYEDCATCGANPPGCDTCDPLHGLGALNYCYQCLDANCTNCSADYLVCTVCGGGTVLDSVTKRCCTTNCQKCSSSAPKCDICNDGFRLKSDGTCEACSDANCLKCDGSATICDLCDPAYELNSGGQYCCTPNCEDCAAATPDCTRCKSGYRLNGTTCQACTAPYCDTCHAANTNCTACQTNYNLVGSDCCVLNCAACNANRPLCNNCSPNYGLKGNGHCDLCIDPNCTDCASDYSNCTTCSGGFTLINGDCCNHASCLDCSASAPTCTSCAPTYGVVGGTCVACTDTNCDQCDGDQNRCNQCQASFPHVDTNGKCCAVFGCSDCTSNASSCDTCYDGYKLNAAGTVCEECAELCASCEVALDVCVQCKDSKAEPLGNGEAGCKCIPGYYTKEDVFKCHRCHIDCATCEMEGRCLTCRDENLRPTGTQGCGCPGGKYEVSRVNNIVTCADCDENCAACLGPGSCTACANSRQTVNSDGNCICKDIYIDISFNGVPNCKLCEEAPQDNRCKTCKSGYYFNGSQCIQCSPVCETCQYTANGCLSCAEGTYPDKNTCKCYLGFQLVQAETPQQ